MRTEYEVPKGRGLAHAPEGWTTTGFAVVVDGRYAVVDMVTEGGRLHDVPRDVRWVKQVGTEVVKV